MKKKIKQIDVKPDENIKKLISDMDNTGFGAKRLARACKIYEKMVKTKNCKKFFALAGAMVPVGMQRVIHDMLDLGFIDVLVTTGANLTHDVVETLGLNHLQGNIAKIETNDVKLYDERMNRIYDVFMPNQVYESMEDFIIEHLNNNFDKNMSVKEFLWLLGEKLPNHPHSILKVCSEKRIPIFCPAFTDSGLAMQVHFSNNNLNLNHFSDLNEMINYAWDAEIAGVCIVGGGVPKNYIFQAMQFSPNQASFAIQVTMDRPEPGGLSGAEIREAISWGKINKNAEYSTVIADATIILPLLLSYLKTTCL
ncbi:MAG: deoxyhypusine synthase [Candidatus Lokiarchaeota archaeon]|nr:deoxyhypusine synthase [Candidatus Lokiarchaeota archaeon]